MQREFLACILASSTAVKFAEVCNQTTHLLPHSIPTKNTAIVSTHLLLEKHGAAGSYRNSIQRKSKVDLFLLSPREHHSAVPPATQLGSTMFMPDKRFRVRKVTKKMLNVSAGTAELLWEISSEWWQAFEPPLGTETTEWGLYKHDCNRWFLSLWWRKVHHRHFHWKLSKKLSFYKMFSLHLISTVYFWKPVLK